MWGFFWTGVRLPSSPPEEIKDLLYNNRSFLLQWKHKDKSKFEELLQCLKKVYYGNENVF